MLKPNQQKSKTKTQFRPPSNTFINYQNQMSHYKHLYNVKHVIQTNPKFNKILPSKLNGKYADIAERQRITNNSNLIKHLQQIRFSRRSINSSQSSKSSRSNNSFKHPITVSTSRQRYHQKQLQKQLQMNNSRNQNKLKQVQPIVGNINQWKKHQNEMRAQSRKLSRNPHRQDQFFDTFFNLQIRNKKRKQVNSSNKTQRNVPYSSYEKKSLKQKLSPLNLKPLLSNRNPKNNNNNKQKLIQPYFRRSQNRPRLDEYATISDSKINFQGLRHNKKHYRYGIPIKSTIYMTSGQTNFIDKQTL